MAVTHSDLTLALIEWINNTDTYKATLNTLKPNQFHVWHRHHRLVDVRVVGDGWEVQWRSLDDALGAAVKGVYDEIDAGLTAWRCGELLNTRTVHEVSFTDVGQLVLLVFGIRDFDHHNLTDFFEANNGDIVEIDAPSAAADILSDEDAAQHASNHWLSFSHIIESGIARGYFRPGIYQLSISW